MSDFIQQLFETLQIDIAEETSEAVGTGLSFTVIILLALAAYIAVPRNPISAAPYRMTHRMRETVSPRRLVNSQE
jgi:hypothetical protein